MKGPAADNEALVPRDRPAHVVELEAPSVSLPPGAAQALREFAGSSAGRSGLRRLAVRQEPWTVVLNPSESTRKALKAGDLVLAKSRKGGQLLPQARDVKTGRVVENIRLKEAAAPGAGVKAARAATAGAAVAWQAMAVATQQHYLVEISSRLTDIERGVADVVRRQIAEKASDLVSTEHALSMVEEHISSAHPLTDTERQDVRSWHKSAHSFCDEHARHARAVLEDPTRDSVEALSDLLVADRAARIAARCAASLLRMPPESPEKHLAQFWHYSDLTQQLLDEVDELFETLACELVANINDWREYVKTRPRTKPKKMWNAGPGRTELLHWGAEAPRVKGLYELRAAEKSFVMSRARAARERHVEPLEVAVLIEGENARVLVDEQSSILDT